MTKRSNGVHQSLYVRIIAFGECIHALLSFLRVHQAPHIPSAVISIYGKIEHDKLHKKRKGQIERFMATDGLAVSPRSTQPANWSATSLQTLNLIHFLRQSFGVYRANRGPTFSFI